MSKLTIEIKDGFLNRVYVNSKFIGIFSEVKYTLYTPDNESSIVVIDEWSRKLNLKNALEINILKKELKSSIDQFEKGGNNMHENMMPKTMKESLAIQASIVLPPDTNHHGTLFGGKLMAYIDNVASISATRHCRKAVVTASNDRVDFLAPIKVGHSVCLKSFVTWTGNSSMEVFVKIIAENLLTGKRELCATSFLTFVALDENGKPTTVPPIVPETEEEKWLFETADERVKFRKKHREESKKLANKLKVEKSWEL